MTDALNWFHGTSDVPERGLTANRSATVEERAALAGVLGIQTVDSLTTEYRITALAGGGYRLDGRCHAGVTQPCIVTLDPVAQMIDETFDVEFWPEVEARDSEGELDVLSGRDVEALEHGTIPVGRIVFETVSAAIDPYPRRDGASFDWQDQARSEAAATSPFAVLSRLKDKS